MMAKQGCEQKYYKVPYNRIPKTGRGKLLFFTLFICYVCTWLPYFGFANSLIWIGPITLPMAWVLLMNAINTVAVFLIYLWFFQYVEYEPGSDSNPKEVP